MSAVALQTYDVRTHQGDTLDEVMHRHGCTHSIETVSQLNSPLIGQPSVLPYNTTVHLPYNLSATRAGRTVKQRKTLNLWS